MSSTARRMGSRVVGVSAAALGLIAVSALPAAAHHPEISATANCDGSIDWATIAWNGPTEGARTNPDVRISKKVDGGPRTQVAAGAFNQDNGFRFSGSFAVGTPLPESVQVFVKAHSPWGNDRGGGEERSVTVDLPGNCPPAPVLEPAATIGGTECDTVLVTLDNTASNRPVDYTVTAPDGDTAIHTVPADETRELQYDALPNATTAVAAPDMNPVEATEGACQAPSDPPIDPVGGEDAVVEPAATIGGTECDTVLITLDNTASNRPVDYTVTAPDGDTAIHTVPADETRELQYDAVPNATTAVAAPDMTLVEATEGACGEVEPTVEVPEPTDEDPGVSGEGETDEEEQEVAGVFVDDETYDRELDEDEDAGSFALPNTGVDGSTLLLLLAGSSLLGGAVLRVSLRGSRR